MPISADGTYTPLDFNNRRSRNPDAENAFGREFARLLGVEYDPRIHNMQNGESLINSPEALAKWREMEKGFETAHDKRHNDFQKKALLSMAALAAIAVTAGAASGAFTGGAGTTAGTTAGSTAAGVGKGVGFAGQAAGAGVTKGAVAAGAAGQAAGAGTAALGTGGALGAAAPAAGGGLTMATVPTIATGTTAAGGIAVPSMVGGASAAAAPTVTAGGAGMFANMSTSQWLKMGLSTASSAYTAYEENKAKKEQAEFMQKEAKRMQQWEADRINRIRSGPLSKIAPFIMQDALNIYGGRGSRMDINTVMNMMGVADLSGMTPFTGFGGSQQPQQRNNGNAATQAMGA